MTDKEEQLCEGIRILRKWNDVIFDDEGYRAIIGDILDSICKNKITVKEWPKFLTDTHDKYCEPEEPDIEDVKAYFRDGIFKVMK